MSVHYGAKPKLVHTTEGTFDREVDPSMRLSIIEYQNALSEFHAALGDVSDDKVLRTVLKVPGIKGVLGDMNLQSDETTSPHERLEKAKQALKDKLDSVLQLKISADLKHYLLTEYQSVTEGANKGDGSLTTLVFAIMPTLMKRFKPK